MKIGLFVDGQVGDKICEIFEEKNVSPHIVVFNADGGKNKAEKLKQAFPDAAVISWSEFKSSDQKFDLGILAWWPFILKADQITRAATGYLNFHPSFLPYGRGKNPNFWALVDQTPFGVTLQWVDETIDGGDIAFQREIETGWLDTGKTLYEKALAEIVELFRENFQQIVTGDIPRRPQPEGFVTHYMKELDPASALDLNKSVITRDLLNLLRARTFPPHAACHFTDENGEKYEVRIEITKIS